MGFITDDEKDDEKKVNEWLRERGVVHSITDLYYHRDWSPDCVPQLLEVFKSATSSRMRMVIASALFARKPNRTQKRDALEIILALVRSKPTGGSDLSILVLNELANNIESDKVHEIGEMTFDERYRSLWPEFTHVLYKIGNAEAISYLIRAAKDPVASSLALAGLAKLRIPGTLELCESALKNPNIPYKDAIRETYSKLKRQLAKKQAPLSHVTKAPVPKGLSEWSVNLEGRDLPKVLRKVQKCLEGGLAKAEISEARMAADNLSVDDTVRLRFPVKFMGEESALWLEVFCDDEDAYDLYIFGQAALIRQIERVSENIPE